MFRASKYFLLALILFLSACAAKQPIGPDAPREKLDSELTGRWQHLNHGAPLTAEEKKALDSPLKMSFNPDDHGRKAILDQFLFLKRDIPQKISVWLKRSEPYILHAKKVFAQYGIPEELAYLGYIESGFNAKAYSSAGAAGIWQFMPFTGRKYGLQCNTLVDERRNPYKSVHAAAQYLLYLHKMFNDWSLAIASYNAGEGTISRAIHATGSRDFFELYKKNAGGTGRSHLAQETLDYVPRFIAMAKIANNTEMLGFDPVRPQPIPDLREMEARPNVNLRSVAQASGMDYDAFQQYNMEFMRDVTPPGQTSIIRVPAQYAASVKTALARAATAPAVAAAPAPRGSKVAHSFTKVPAPAKAANVSYETSTATASRGKTHPESKKPNYTVQSGDSLHSLARRFNINVAELAQVNGVGINAQLLIDQKIYVPGLGGKNAHVAEAKSPKPSKIKVYSVQSGDTLASVAKKFDVSPTSLQQWNNLKANSKLKPGDAIVVTK